MTPAFNIVFLKINKKYYTVLTLRNLENSYHIVLCMSVIVLQNVNERYEHLVMQFIHSITVTYSYVPNAFDAS